MGRHYRGTCRNPVTMRSKDVNRPIWLLEMPKSPSGVLSAIGIAVIISFFIFCFLWSLRKLPQEDSEYPDGFIQCPEVSSYRIPNNRTMKCKACPECPPGQEPTPPCGSTILIDTPIKCTMCVLPETFSEEHSSGACQPCQSCGLRDTISPCTPQKNTQCGHCPRGQYQADLTMDSCKKCSSCCGGRRYAELECIYLKQCKRTNCHQQIENMRDPALTVQKIMQTFTTPAGRVRHIEREHQNILKGSDLDNARKIMASAKAGMFPTEKERFKRADNPILQKEDIDGGATTKEEEASFRFQAKHSNPSTRAIVTSAANEPNTSFPVTKSRFDDYVDTAPEEKDMEPTMPLNASYFGDLKKLRTILVLIASFGLPILTFIAVIVTCNFCKGIHYGHTQGSGCIITCCVKYVGLDKKEYLPVSYDSTPQSDSEDYECSPISDNMVDITSHETDVDSGGLERITLTEIPLDLMDLLAIKLDGRCNGERLYGWQKVGRKLNIGGDVLNNLENEYRSPAGSPTRQLLELLACQRRPVGELVNALKSSDVNFTDTATFVEKYFRDQRD